MSEAFADAVVVAAGASRRMHGTDKLAASIEGRPLLARSIEAMAGARSVGRVIVVAAPERVEELRAAAWLAALGADVVAGGQRRSDSVLAGVAASSAEVILVHDGARPLASPALADAVAMAAAEHGAAVPVMPVVDSIKRTDGGLVTSGIEREGLFRAQTPQGCRRELLLGAFRSAGGADFGDEAALLESSGVAVTAIPGEALNLKVTEPGDLELVRALYAGRARPHESRIGLGHDSHPFGPADGLWLAGVEFPEAPRLYGHSDGDVALHALATAILAACGMGDLGRIYPSTDASSAGAASTRLLRGVLDKAAQAGWRPAAAQISLLGARPRLGAERLESMRRRVAEILAVEPGLVSMTASSGNLGGAEGAGRVISASAMVTMSPAATRPAATGAA